MAQRPGFPTVQTPQTGASIGNAHTNNILQNFRQEDVVYALMTQLREKESELTRLHEHCQLRARHQQSTEESNRQLISRVDLHNKTVAEKDTRIALLEQKLAKEKKVNGSAIAEANLKHLTDTNAESQILLQERDVELSQLRPLAQELKAKIEEYEAKENVQHSAKLEEELAQVKEELAAAKEQNETLNNTAEHLEKKIKGKEWMIKSLQEENEDQRGRENHLLAHIRQLNERIDTYEERFNGKGVDVTMLLAKLKDYEARTKDLQGQVRRLTNKKLNELVLRSSPIPRQSKENKKPATKTKKCKQQDESRKPLQQEEEADDMSEVSETYSFLNSVQDDDEEDTFLESLGSIDMDYHRDDDDDTFSPKLEHEEDVLSDFLSDVKVGIQTLEIGALCCAQRPSTADLSSPRIDPHGSMNLTYTSGSQL